MLLTLILGLLFARIVAGYIRTYLFYIGISDLSRVCLMGLK